MEKVIMVGCDLHDENMLLKVAMNREAPEKLPFKNTKAGRRAMIKDLLKRRKAAKANRVVFAYEASGLGFGLYDELADADIECHVLAPTKIERSAKHRRNKTDERDAQRILEIVRGHVLAGNEMPSVWIPDHETRDDRDLVRARLDVAEKYATVKNQVRTLLKRNGIRTASGLGKGWTKRYVHWLEKLTKEDSVLKYGGRTALASLLRQMTALAGEIEELDGCIEALGETLRYAEPFRELLKLKGVGPLTAMVYLTEMGDLSRFTNRREIGSYLGIVPSSNESGKAEDRKGHITHQGPARIRKVLCQAAWAVIRSDGRERAIYDGIVARNPKHKKIAVVALMRRLAIRMWHRGVEAQERSGSFRKLERLVALDPAA